jgi:hypothetical protein
MKDYQSHEQMGTILYKKIMTDPDRYKHCYVDTESTLGE